MLRITTFISIIHLKSVLILKERLWFNSGLLKLLFSLYTVNQQILAAINFGVSQNKVIYVNLAAIKFGVSPRPVCVVYDRRICWRRQILAKTRNSPNSPNIIARQNLLIYSKCLAEKKNSK